MEWTEQSVRSFIGSYQEFVQRLAPIVNAAFFEKSGWIIGFCTEQPFHLDVKPTDVVGRPEIVVLWDYDNEGDPELKVAFPIEALWTEGWAEEAQKRGAEKFRKEQSAREAKATEYRRKQYEILKAEFESQGETA